MPVILTTFAKPVTKLCGMAKRPRIKPKRPPKIYIREWREAMDLSLDDMAARLRTSKATLSRKETMHRVNDLDWIAACAEVFNRNLEDMFHPPGERRADEMVRDMPPEMRDIALDALSGMLSRTRR